MKISINEVKERMLLNRGWVKVERKGKSPLYQYKGYQWTAKQVAETATVVIATYSKFYDGIYTLHQLEHELKFMHNKKLSKSRIKKQY